MAYPTTINFLCNDSRIGTSSLTSNSTTQACALGTVIRAVDSAYGEGQFIYLSGVASTVAGSSVIYNSKTGVTALTTTLTRGPVAVAMAPTVAGQYGWYQLTGAGVVASGIGTINTMCAGSGSNGAVTAASAANVKIDGMYAVTAQDAPGTGFIGVQMVHPSMNGNT